MSSNKRTLWIIAAIVLIIIILMSLVYEIRDVPDVDWKKTYDFEERGPNGYWLFSELVGELYQDAEVIIADTSTHLSDYFDQDDVLYIKLSNQYAPDPRTMEDLASFSASGNDVLFMIRNAGDSLEQVLREHDQFIYQWSDTILSVSWLGGDLQSVDTLDYVHYADDFDAASLFDFKYLSSYADDSLKLSPVWLSMDQDSTLIFGKFTLDESVFYLHTVPQLYTNMALKQREMVDNLQRTISYFNPQIVILDSRRDRMSRNISATDTPMDYVLAQPSLRWAYYLIILGLLTYVLFRGRRRQRIIPVAPRYDNTSLDHVEMLAQLYGSQQQHNKLIGHMRKLFFHKNEQHYYLKPSNPEYTLLLSQKSKVPKEEIEILMNRFDAVSKSKKFNAYDLNVFYKTLQRFYDKCS